MSSLPITLQGGRQGLSGLPAPVRAYHAVGIPCSDMVCIGTSFLVNLHHAVARDESEDAVAVDRIAASGKFVAESVERFLAYHEHVGALLLFRPGAGDGTLRPILSPPSPASRVMKSR